MEITSEFKLDDHVYTLIETSLLNVLYVILNFLRYILGLIKNMRMTGWLYIIL